MARRGCDAAGMVAENVDVKTALTAFRQSNVRLPIEL
jgi:hypothetical protein